MKTDTIFFIYEDDFGTYRATVTLDDGYNTPINYVLEIEVVDKRTETTIAAPIYLGISGAILLICICLCYCCCYKKAETDDSFDDEFKR